MSNFFNWSAFVKAMIAGTVVAGLPALSFLTCWLISRMCVRLEKRSTNR